MNTEAKTILVADDNPITARCVGNLIPRIGFDAVLAFHGEEALNHLVNAQFVAVITDVDMPGMNGFELLQNIRLYHPELPVALMTASCNAAWREAARACGAWALLEKPVTSDTFRRCSATGRKHTALLKACTSFGRHKLNPRAPIKPQVNSLPPICRGGKPARKSFLRDFLFCGVSISVGHTFKALPANNWQNTVPLLPDGQRGRNDDNFEKTNIDAMNLNTMFSRLNLTVAALLLLLAGAVLLAGCETTGDNDTSAHDHSSGQGSCH